MLASLVTTIETLDRVYTTVKSDGVKDGIERLGTGKGREVFYAQGSMIKFLSRFIIEPKIVVSDSLKGTKEANKMIKFQMDLFTALYTRVFDVLTKVHGLDAETSFSLLSSRSGLDSVGGRMAGIESGDIFQDVDLENDMLIFGVEDAKETEDEKKQREKLEKYTKKVAKDAADEAAKKLKKEAKELAKELHVNKDLTKGSYDSELKTLTYSFMNEVKMQIDVKNADGDTFRIDIPVIVKPTIIYTRFENIQRLMKVNDRDKKFWSRWDEYRAGAITLRDLIFAGDLVNDYKKNRLKDNDKLILDAANRSRSSATKYISDGAAGFNKYYQMIIVDQNEGILIENQLGGKLSKPDKHEEFLEQTKSLTLSVMDFDYEMISLYLKDTKDGSTLSFGDIAPKDKGFTAEEMMKIVQLGRSY